MFETETMAELCLKQGLVLDALTIYRRLLASSPDQGARARHARRIAELEARADGPGVPTQPQPAPAMTGGKSGRTTGGTTERTTGGTTTDIQVHHDQLQVTFQWRLPLNTPAPALQILVLRRDPSGIATEQRTVRLSDAQGTLTLPIADVHSLRAAAGTLEGDRFVPLARLDGRFDARLDAKRPPEPT